MQTNKSCLKCCAFAWKFQWVPWKASKERYNIKQKRQKRKKNEKKKKYQWTLPILRVVSVKKYYMFFRGLRSVLSVSCTFASIFSLTDILPLYCSKGQGIKLEIEFKYIYWQINSTKFQQLANRIERKPSNYYKHRIQNWKFHYQTFVQFIQAKKKKNNSWDLYLLV